MKAAGMQWLALNVREHAPAEWDVVRSRADALNMPCKPWARLGLPDQGETRDDCLVMLQTIYQACDAWGENGIPNVETEFERIFPPDELAAEIDHRIEGLSSVAWLYNAVNFTPVAHLPLLLQIFKTDNRWTVDEIEKRQADCVLHAREKGFTYVGVTFQTYGGAQPSWYAYHSGTRSYFTGDDIGGGQWAPWKV